MSYRSAFTLIELLVALAIIIILAAILFPVFEQAAKKAESTTCLSNLRGLALAAMLYSDDHDDYLPPALMPASPPGYAICWDRLLLPYLRNQEMYVCISDPNPTPGPAWTYSLRHSYGINLTLTMVGGYQAASLNRHQLSDAGRAILFFDLNQPYSYGWDASWGNLSQYVAERHLGGTNFAFCGGNAKWMDAEATLQGAGMWGP